MNGEQRFDIAQDRIQFGAIGVVQSRP